MPVLTVMNQKGGVGKTTTSLNLAAGLRERGHRVLIVDFDPQASLTACCGLTDDTQRDLRGTIADAVLTAAGAPANQALSLRDVIIATPVGIDLAPATQDLATAEAVLHTVYGRERVLRDVLDQVRGSYDVILIDAVPTVGLLGISALTAANGLIIPVQAEFLAVHGLAQLFNSVALVRERLNPYLDVWGIVLTMVDARSKHSREMIATIRERFAEEAPVFQTSIPLDVKLKESSKVGTTIFTHAPSARATTAYRELAAEVEAMLASGHLVAGLDGGIADSSLRSSDQAASGSHPLSSPDEPEAGPSCDVDGGWLSIGSYRGHPAPAVVSGHGRHGTRSSSDETALEAVNRGDRSSWSASGASTVGTTMADDGTSWPAGSENATGERLDEPSADAPRRRSKVAPEREDIIPPMLRRVLEAGIRVDAPASAMGSRFAERDERAAGEADVIERGREALDYADRGPSEHHDVDAAGYSEERLRLRYVTTASTDPVVSQPRWYSLHDSDDAHANHAEAALPISSAGGRPTARPAVKSKTYSWPPKPRN